jgi:hypothetical protein
VMISDGAVGLGGITITDTALDAEAPKFDVPPYDAVIIFVPVANVARLKVATPLVMVPVPIDAPLFKKVTAPLVTGLPPLVTVAVSATFSP